MQYVNCIRHKIEQHNVGDDADEKTGEDDRDNRYQVYNNDNGDGGDRHPSKTSQYY